ncbi:potassium-transporting ATPase subunit KdpC [Legionella hackeliae]|uniref:Potassium-transporting ATPase KdpC subunit n=1 Tax=Legionella hackeliae TaxID=449 RepID=A0A0A8UTI6_LEGHA|nr:potassium-transporting ATPase subunit KdpC [Legionella hackeliae]KTD14202.1 potassium translocating ATPase, subunit C [Legionella hackeliae]CEK10412.1 Potassium-transporting ATPase C chain [Legionella hackeliae]STX47147.1 potassium translocating ATPase, subunit C [Legionella hackeliae]
MFNEAFKQLKSAAILLIILTLVTGVIYPLAVTGIAQLFFPWKANGSLIKQENKVVGSLLIGQLFEAPQYFWGRPSATMPYPYNALNSSGSNLGPSNPAFFNAVNARVARLHENDPTNERLIPVDLVTASGSGLDPEISLLAALYQVPRVARARNKSETDIEALINRLVKNRTMLVLGEPRINVLELNLALDK